MIPATVEIKRLTGKRGEANGAFHVKTWTTPQGDSFKSVYVGAERATCHACRPPRHQCEHIAAARALVESERQA